MKYPMLMKAAGVMCAAVIAVTALAGCGSQEGAITKEQAENRQYMTEVNRAMEDLQGRLGSFTDAVSQGDVVGMKTQADNAYKALDDLEKVNVPEGLADIQKEYLDGANELKSALSAYVELYAEIDSATEAQPFDYSTYHKRIADIRTQYEEGIEKLQEGDKKASEKS